MATDVQIANKALIQLGVRPIAEFTIRQEARTLNALYSKTATVNIDQLLCCALYYHKTKIINLVGVLRVVINTHRTENVEVTTKHNPDDCPKVNGFYRITEKQNWRNRNKNAD